VFLDEGFEVVFCRRCLQDIWSSNLVDFFIGDPVHLLERDVDGAPEGGVFEVL